MEPPILVGELELTEPIGDIKLSLRDDGKSYKGVRLLVRIQHLPVGYVYLSPDALDTASVRQAVWQQLSSAINAVRARYGLPALAALPGEGVAAESDLAGGITERPYVSVVLCTRDRTEGALVSLRGLAALCYEPFEIVLVDNAPGSEATRDAVLAEFGDDPPGQVRARAQARIVLRS